MIRQLAAFAFAVLGVTASQAEPSRVRSISMVILADAKLPPADDLKRNLQERLGKTLTIEAMETGENVVLFRIAGGTVAVGLVDRPIPNGELEDVCRFAWWWKEACDSVAKHKAHLLVTVLDTKLDDFDAALLATQTMAASMADHNAIAGYWGTNLQPRDAFLKQSARASRQLPPVMLWINYRMSNEPLKGWTISTNGMKHFGLMEIECKEAPVDGRSVFSLIVQTSAYLLTKGPVIQDGETIGESAALNIQVRHAPSYWTRGGTKGDTVYRVVYPK